MRNILKVRNLNL